MVRDFQMDVASLLCDGVEQLQDSGLLMVTEVVGRYEWQEEVLFGRECCCYALGSQSRVG